MNRLLLTLCFGLALLSGTGCSRSASQVWDDTKTAQRYAGRGIRSLWGKHGDSRQVGSNEEFFAKGEEDFVPLEDNDFYQQLNRGESSSLAQLEEEQPIPQPRQSPGDPGSQIPGIDHFTPASSSALAGLFRPVYFPYNSNLIKGRESLEVVKNIAHHMEEHDNLYVFVSGHCDERGSAAYNLALGARRANAVRRVLVKEGVDPERVFTISYGKERPQAMGHDETAWRLNRRSEFHVYQR